MWAATILALSTGASIQPPQISHWLEPDKLAHAAAYFVMASLLLWGIHRSHRLQPRHFFLVLVFSSGYGISLEIVQWAFFPGRVFEFLDIIANIIGSFGSVLVYFLIK
ncbi:MAG: VanZ family protein [Phaeodactylibacter sp.]|nr:VanZ family protein [Phaeodactylibacter sp.]MCB9301918.1 VanZ family protein [Lewinellaceae bacterium]